MRENWTKHKENKCEKKCFTVEETLMGSKRENTYEVTKEMQIKIK